MPQRVTDAPGDLLEEHLFLPAHQGHDVVVRTPVFTTGTQQQAAGCAKLGRPLFQRIEQRFDSADLAIVTVQDSHERRMPRFERGHDEPVTRTEVLVQRTGGGADAGANVIDANAAQAFACEQLRCGCCHISFLVHGPSVQRSLYM